MYYLSKKMLTTMCKILEMPLKCFILKYVIIKYNYIRISGYDFKYKLLCIISTYYK